MKVIIIPLFQGVVVRNLLRTDFPKLLLEDPDIRLVCLVKSEEKKAYLEKDFSSPQIVYLVASEYQTPPFNSLFTFLKFNLLHTKRMDVRRKIILERTKNYPAFVLKFVFNRLFSYKFFRQFVRSLDRKLVRDKNYASIIEKYKPDLVISAHPFGDDEMSLIRAAKKQNITTLAIINSWDKLTSRGIIRILPDEMVVPNAITKKEAQIHADMDENAVHVTGMPYFDQFFKKKPRTREWFYGRFSIEEKKKVLLICPTGRFYSKLDADLINRVSDLISEGKVPSDLQILVRFPPNDTVDTSKIKERKKIIFYQPGIRFNSKRGVDWDMNEEDNQLLLDMLQHSSVVICPPSSISVDAAILDRPIINVKFGTKTEYSDDNIDLYYEADHYKHILCSGGIRLVQGDKELASWINKYLKNPAEDREGRRRIMNEQCAFTDGKSAERLAYVIKTLLKNDEDKRSITSICYHYIKRDDEFKRIWGHSFELFKKHVDFLKKKYPPISLSDLDLALQGKKTLQPKSSIVTFDDGLKEHLMIGKYLAKRNIKALFNVCSDTILERKPVTAQALHFGTAYFGVKKCARLIESYVRDSSMKKSYREALFRIESTTPEDANIILKNFFNKNELHYEVLAIMQEFWRDEIEKVVPGAFEKIFLNLCDLKELILLGHEVGLHTKSHFSFKGRGDKDAYFIREIAEPKEELEEVLGIKIRAFAYPFGKRGDILSLDEFEAKFKAIGLDYVFTTFYDNISSLRPCQIGRYLSQSTDTVQVLKDNLWYYEVGNNHKQLF